MTAYEFTPATESPLAVWVASLILGGLLF